MKLISKTRFDDLKKQVDDLQETLKEAFGEDFFSFNIDDLEEEYVTELDWVCISEERFEVDYRKFHLLLCKAPEEGYVLAVTGTEEEGIMIFYGNIPTILAAEAKYRIDLIYRVINRRNR